MGRPVIRASVDGFHNPKTLRYRHGRNSPEGFFEDSYDYPSLRTYLLDPLSRGGPRRFRTAMFNHLTDALVSGADREAAESTILLLDGIFLHRPELRGYWDFSIFLQVDFTVSIARCATRDGSSPNLAAPANRCYVEGQLMYLSACDPAARATLTIDYNDLSAPVLLSKG